MIPMLALRREFHGKPEQRPRYSDQIIGDLVGRAQADGIRSLGLVVHVQNEAALRLYVRHGFECFGEAFDEDGVRYRPMARVIEPARPAAS
jgi:ribosomal protein S18 acetylase RimI-like enzyme